jgi:hypothetical protein
VTDAAAGPSQRTVSLGRVHTGEPASFGMAPTLSWLVNGVDLRIDGAGGEH